VTSLKTWAAYVGSGLVLLFAIGAVGWFWGRSELRKDIALAPRDTTNHIDTVMFPIRELVYVHLPGKVTTVHDTTLIQPEATVASLDTVMAVHHDTLGIKYFFPPNNFFNVDFKPGPVPVMVKTMTVEKTGIGAEISIPWVIGVAAVGITTGIIIDKKLK